MVALLCFNDFVASLRPEMDGDQIYRSMIAYTQSLNDFDYFEGMCRIMLHDCTFCDGYTDALLKLLSPEIFVFRVLSNELLPKPNRSQVIQKILASYSYNRIPYIIRILGRLTSRVTGSTRDALFNVDSLITSDAAIKVLNLVDEAIFGVRGKSGSMIKVWIEGFKSLALKNAVSLIPVNKIDPILDLLVARTGRSAMVPFRASASTPPKSGDPSDDEDEDVDEEEPEMVSDIGYAAAIAASYGKYLYGAFDSAPKHVEMVAVRFIENLIAKYLLRLRFNDLDTIVRDSTINGSKDMLVYLVDSIDDILSQPTYIIDKFAKMAIDHYGRRVDPTVVKHAFSIQFEDCKDISYLLSVNATEMLTRLTLSEIVTLASAVKRGMEVVSNASKTQVMSDIYLDHCEVIRALIQDMSLSVQIFKQFNSVLIDQKIISECCMKFKNAKGKTILDALSIASSTSRRCIAQKYAKTIGSLSLLDMRMGKNNPVNVNHETLNNNEPQFNEDWSNMQNYDPLFKLTILDSLPIITDRPDVFSLRYDMFTETEMTVADLSMMALDYVEILEKTTPNKDGLNFDYALQNIPATDIGRELGLPDTTDYRKLSIELFIKYRQDGNRLDDELKRRLKDYGDQEDDEESDEDQEGGSERNGFDEETYDDFHYTSSHF